MLRRKRDLKKARFQKFQVAAWTDTTQPPPCLICANISASHVCIQKAKRIGPPNEYNCLFCIQISQNEHIFWMKWHFNSINHHFHTNPAQSVFVLLFSKYLHTENSPQLDEFAFFAHKTLLNHIKQLIKIVPVTRSQHALFQKKVVYRLGELQASHIIELHMRKYTS